MSVDTLEQLRDMLATRTLGAKGCTLPRVCVALELMPTMLNLTHAEKILGELKHNLSSVPYPKQYHDIFLDILITISYQ